MVSYSKLYVTPDEVRVYLGVDEDKYPDELLVNLIWEKMDYVDHITNTTWNGRLKRVREMHDITRYKGGWLWGAGIPIHLGHPYVKKVEHLYVQWASKNEDWVRTRNEGRNFGSYWLDYQTGILYIQTWALYQGGKEIKIQYVYGREDLPYEIKELTKLLVVRDLIMNERRLFALAEGAQGVSWSEYVRYLDERIKMLSEQYRALKPGYVVSYEMGELSDEEAEQVWNEWYSNEHAW